MDLAGWIEGWLNTRNLAGWKAGWTLGTSLAGRPAACLALEVAEHWLALAWLRRLASKSLLIDGLTRLLAEGAGWLGRTWLRGLAGGRGLGRSAELEACLRNMPVPMPRVRSGSTLVRLQ